jgi:Fe-S oxidoreductase
MALDWSAWPGAAGGFQGAVEMCNNNGACRKLAGGVMCPSYRATLDERDVTRGRANTLRMAISGQLGRDAFTSDGVLETLSLCVSCKGCRRECPTGVDIARMKIEVLHSRAQQHGLSWRARLVAYLPRYAPYGAQVSALLNLRDRLPGAAAVSERLFGLSAKRKLPRWRSDAYRAPAARAGCNLDESPPGGGPHPGPPPRGGREQKGAPSLPSPSGGGAGGGARLENAMPKSSRSSDGRDVVLLADTFNRYFEPENLRSAHAVLSAAGYRVVEPTPGGERPLCCGRTFLAAGLVDEARHEARRLLDACLPHAERGTAIVGLEPSCLLGLRDEIPVMLPGAAAQTLAGRAQLFEEFLAAEADAGRLSLGLRTTPAKALLHGHCHQKAFDAMGAVEKTLRLVPGLEVETVQSSCCGMAGAFGYQAETYDVSMKMAELSLAPAVRAAPEDTLIVADGTSCRQQIEHATGREARHVARVLHAALA